MSDFEKRNAKLARLEQSRKRIVARGKAKKVAVLATIRTPESCAKGGRASAKIERTCTCGRVLAGTLAWFNHTRACDEYSGRKF